jgi:hypothetical protein
MLTQPFTEMDTLPGFQKLTCFYLNVLYFYLVIVVDVRHSN